jgi:hypothetical protein
MNLFVLLYKITNDENTYVVLDADAAEQQETKARVLGSALLDWLKVGRVPVEITEEYGPSRPPIPLYNKAIA